MIRKVILLFLIVFLLSNICALCNETQIDINTASLEKLQEITQIGPSRAQQIISLRPFSSVDDLARVSGIGNGTRLNQIKSQGLACVDKDTTPETPKNNEIELTETKENKTIDKDNNHQGNKTIYAKISSEFKFK